MRTFIDLFAGIGGFRMALERFGLECVFSSEIDDHAAKTYADNFGEYPAGDITKIAAEEIPEHDLLCGGFPCQPFSMCGDRDGVADPRGTLFWEILRIAKHRRPKAMLLENVTGLTRGKMVETFGAMLDSLAGIGYDPFWAVLDASRYGIPQKRVRLYITALRKDLGWSWVPPEPTDEPCKLADVLDPEETIDERYYLSEKALKGAVAHRKRHMQKGNGFGFQIADPEGKANTLLARYFKGGNEIMIDSDKRKMKLVGKTGKGGRGTHIYDPEGVAPTMTYSGGGRASTELVQVGMVNGKNMQANRIYSSEGLGRTQIAEGGGMGAKTGLYQVGDFSGVNMQGYRIYSPEGTAQTQTSNSGGLAGNTGVYEIGKRVRRLTPREATRLMGFPDSFRIHPTDSHAYKQAGNSVIPRMVMNVFGGIKESYIGQDDMFREAAHA